MMGALDLLPMSARRRLNFAFYEALDRFVGFDRRHGTCTRGESEHLDIDDGQRNHANPHQACSPSVIRRALAETGLDPRTTAFVDLGCGKGRALLVANEYPFARIIGVELSPTLLQIAQENAQRCGLLERPGFELRCQSATDFEPPPDDLVVFIFNSFDESVLQGVLERLGESLRASPRRLYIIYQSDNFARALLARTPWLELVSRKNVVPLGYWFMGTWALWRSTSGGITR
jgi:SAM-dependent methyltransferase